MRLRVPAVVAGVLLLSATAGAVVPRGSSPTPEADTLVALPAANIAKPLRVAAQLRFTPPSGAAWEHFAKTVGGSWRVAADRATGVPSRIFGSGIAAPGATANPAVAERVARQVLADHLALLAPGARVADFELVSNQLDGDLRSVGFVQRAASRRVVGGQISFRFKRDRLFVIGSEALPLAAARTPLPTARLSRASLATRAAAALRDAAHLPAARASAPGDEVVLPLVSDDAVLGYRVAVPLVLDGGADGKYLGYADPSTGAILALQQLDARTTGTLLYRGIDRYPAKPRVDRPAPLAHVKVDGAAQTTTQAGTVTWTGSSPVTVTTSTTGDLAVIVNKASGGGLASADLSLAPGGSAVWDASQAEADDAEVQAYLDINIVKQYVAAHVDANMKGLFDQLTVNVNIAQDCNAFFDGTAINFFHATATCQNTALVQDVLYHEFGHDVHASEIIEGVGSFDGAMSEGAADFLAANVTGDHGMGRGFFYTDDPLRDLDPADTEARWPEDIGEIHKTGQIFGGTFWDLRTAMIAAYGEAGIDKTLALYVGALRRSVNIPTSLIEVLATDDDDGDLSNGTPNECLIRDAFARHGLRTASGSVTQPGLLALADVPSLTASVTIRVTGLTTRCSGDEIDSATIDWNPRGMLPVAGSAPATRVDESTFTATVPLAANDKVFYKVTIAFADGSALTLADNLANPYYELYTGDTVNLYCTTFEDDPFAHGWTTGGDKAEWEWGEPTGGATDPHAAFSGTHVLSQVLNGDYAPSTYSWVKSPPIDTGHWSDVHVQYRRWLGVEDSHYDQARVTANDALIWQNHTANMGDDSSEHNIDREWRFHDVPVGGHARGQKLVVGWDLKSDPGLELGGWALDDVCIVANTNAVCGDGAIQASEECDDGAANADMPGMCRTYCSLPRCGDNIVDPNEECDTGGGGLGGCSATCTMLEVPELLGCCSVGGSAAETGALSLLVGALVFSRRTRRGRSR